MATTLVKSNLPNASITEAVLLPPIPITIGILPFTFSTVKLNTSTFSFSVKVTDSPVVPNVTI